MNAAIQSADSEGDPVRMESIEQVQRLLSSHLYVTDQRLATVIYLSLSMKKPLFLEGETGVGKTEVGKVLSEALKRRLIRLQCYEGLDQNSALYEWNYPKQLLQVRMDQEKRCGPGDWTDIFTPDFLIGRPLLDAVQSGARGEPAVLLIDEIDRADDEFEAFLLEFLSEFQVTIPEIGTIRAQGRTAGDYHFEPHPRSTRSTEAALPLSLDRVSDTGKGSRDYPVAYAPSKQGSGTADFRIHEKSPLDGLYQTSGCCRVTGLGGSASDPAPKTSGHQDSIRNPGLRIQVSRRPPALRSVRYGNNDGTWLGFRRLDSGCKGRKGANPSDSWEHSFPMGSPVSGERQHHGVESGLAISMVRFGRVLRSQGIPVTTGRVLDAIQGLAHIEIGRRSQFRTLLACVLVSNRRDLELFHRIFDAFWRRRPPGDSDESAFEEDGCKKSLAPVFPDILGVSPRDPDEIQQALFRASLEENTAKKPFQDLSAEELFSVEQAVKRLAHIVGTRISRRTRRSNKPGRLDFADTVRKSFRSWGEPVELKYKRRKRRKTRIHLLLDISGSMGRIRSILSAVWPRFGAIGTTDTHLRVFNAVDRGHFPVQGLGMASNSVQNDVFRV